MFLFFQFIHFHQLQYSSWLSKSQLDILHFTFCGIFITNDPAFNPKILKKLIFKNSLLKLLSAVLQCLLTSCVLFSKPQFNNHSGLNIILLQYITWMPFFSTLSKMCIVYCIYLSELYKPHKIHRWIFYKKA